MSSRSVSRSHETSVMLLTVRVYSAIRACRRVSSPFPLSHPGHTSQSCRSKKADFQRRGPLSAKGCLDISQSVVKDRLERVLLAQCFHIIVIHKRRNTGGHQVNEIYVSV